MIQNLTFYHLNQLKELIAQLTDEELKLPLSVLDNATIGKHVRHILEFYICLFNSLECGELSYDRRQRDPEMEVSRNKCTATINLMLRKMHKNVIDFPISLTTDLSLDLIKKEISIDTTYYRELLYNIEHLIHHMAIIRIGVKSLESPIRIDESFGVAVSTIRNSRHCSH